MRIGILVFLLFAAYVPATLAQGGAWPQIVLAPVQNHLSSPVHVTHAGDGSGRLFIVEQAGRIRVWKNDALLDTPFLEISRRVSCCGERGLLSVAFPPRYQTKQHFYVYYTDTAGALVVARYRVTADPDLADPPSEEVVLNIPHPVFGNHNGGQLAFGPDGYLYIGTGDGGGGGDPENHAQNSLSLLGKILRIDVESGVFPYAVPATNPYRGNPDYRGEIWALGARNPWRFSFDRRTGDLYIGDVGQNAYEEIDFQSPSSRGGENYGWRCREGLHGYAGHAGECAGLTLTDPVAEYTHANGHCSVTGGAVYRGLQYRDLNGIYFYGDYCSGQIWGLRFEDGAWTTHALLDSDLSISSFGEDENGELYVVDLGGALYRISSPSSSASGVDLTGAWSTLRQTCKTRRTGVQCTLLGRTLVWNQGTRRAVRRSRTKFYLSSDAVLSAEDVLLRQKLTGRLRAGTTRNLTLRKTLPPGQTALHQYVIAVVDAENRLAELDETNNIIIGGPIQ